jgi:hypothetical protein
MDRRTFAALATACALCLGTRKLSANVILPAAPAEPDDLIPLVDGCQHNLFSSPPPSLAFA